MTWVLVAVAGGLGAVVRYLVDAGSQRLVGTRWGTLVVNVTGSLVAGVLAGFVLRGDLGVDGEVILAGGFLGAYTTFSTAMVQAAGDLLEGRRGRAVLDLLASLLLTLAAATTGVLLVG